ncbi:hypothetical protein BURK2_04026 [Burkholderiales bacterium]|jgi:hypothetical protein|nr:hypothetical protein BURK2_04026 [Burkholderiales bacterium]
MNREPARRVRVALLLVALSIPQAIVHGEALVGRALLLPVDMLASRTVYLAEPIAGVDAEPSHFSLTDLVFTFEPGRRFVSEQLREGRVPLWNPYNYAGVPFALFPVYSPFNLPYYALPSPFTLAWIQWLQALVAGVGAYLLFRRAWSLAFLPALAGAAMLPLTGFAVLWTGYPLAHVIAFLPWLLLAVHLTVERPASRAGIGLAFATAATILGGAIDVAALCLLVSGLYGLTLRLADHVSERRIARLRRSMLGLIAGWGCGILLTAPFLLPAIEHSGRGARVEARKSGSEERPPVGLEALPELALPWIHGAGQRGSIRIIAGNRLESAAGAYAGLLALLALAPFAWTSRRHRRLCNFLAALAVIGLAWQLAIPGFVDLMRMPFLNALSYNRFVFASAFAFVALAAIGLDGLERGGEPRARRIASRIAVAVLLLTGGFALYRSIELPEPLIEEAASALAAGRTSPLLGSPAELDAIRVGFRLWAGLGVALAVVGVVFVGLASRGLLARTTPRVALFLLALAELVVHARSSAVRAAPELYYPPIPILEALAAEELGRVLGIGTLPASLSMLVGFRDLRGYDGTDPRDLVDLLAPVRYPRERPLPYAALQQFTPVLGRNDDGTVRLAPVLDMLAVGSVVLTQPPPGGLAIAARGNGYWVLANRRATPRAYVPERVEVAPRAEQRKRLYRTDFDPRKVAFVEERVGLVGPAEGSAHIASETPHAVRLEAEMHHPGLLVLADRWTPGWSASVDGKAASVYRVNSVLRGVVLPAGHHQVVFTYWPPMLSQGLWLAGLSVAALVAWTLLPWRGTTTS